MTPHRPPTPTAPDGTEGDQPGRLDEAVTGLAREVDALRRHLTPLSGTPERVDELTGVVTDLAAKVAALSARKGPTPCPSWLLAPTDPATIAALLDALSGWMEAVFLRYPDAVTSLPECWCWHPDLVEELLWLMHAWLAAYQGPAAAVGLVADWHDRYRPGVVRRITKTAGSCSRERHQTRPGWDAPTGIPATPGIHTVQTIATWWAARRDEPGPEPALRPDTITHAAASRR